MSLSIQLIARRELLIQVRMYETLISQGSTMKSLLVEPYLTGEEDTFAMARNVNPLNHSYTIQVLVSNAGYLVPKLFICFLEGGGLHVQQNIEQNQPSKTVVTCITSGKLTKSSLGPAMVFRIEKNSLAISGSVPVMILPPESGHCKIQPGTIQN